MYISSYGEIHQQKLQMAYEQIPHKVWAEGSISVVDYGCGQCIAEMVKEALISETVEKIANIGVAAESEIALLSLYYMKRLAQLPDKNSKVRLMEMSKIPTPQAMQSVCHLKKWRFSTY